MPDLQPIQFVVVYARSFSCFRHQILPRCSCEIEAVFFRIYDGCLNCKGIRLDPENICAGICCQFGLKHIRILISRNGLQIHCNSIGVFKALKGLIISIVHPSGRNQDAQLFARKISGFLSRYSESTCHGSDHCRRTSHCYKTFSLH